MGLPRQKLLRRLEVEVTKIAPETGRENGVPLSAWGTRVVPLALAGLT